MRKSELKGLTDAIYRLSVLVQQMAQDAKDINRETKHNSKKSLIINMAAITLSFVLVFGGAEALKKLSIITTAIKALGFIV